MACSCGPDVDIQNYLNQVAVEIPEHMASYREARVKDGLSPLLSIDLCILPELKKLWAQGIVTYGSCCGHNKYPSMVNVADKDTQKMIELGYKPWPEKPNSALAFYLKSCGRNPIQANPQ